MQDSRRQLYGARDDHYFESIFSQLLHGKIQQRSHQVNAMNSVIPNSKSDSFHEPTEYFFLLKTSLTYASGVDKGGKLVLSLARNMINR